MSKEKTGRAGFVMPALLKDERDVLLAGDAIQSVIDQTDEDWQLVVIDDGSDHRLFDQIQTAHNHDERIIFRRLGATFGSWWGRNVGMSIAIENGCEIILFIDADDLCDNDRLVRTRRHFLEDGVAMLYSAFTTIDEFGNQIPDEALTGSVLEILDALRTDPPEGPDAWQEVGEKLGYVTLTSTVAVRASVAALHPFPAEQVSEDTFTWYQYMSEGRLAFDRESIGKYRIRTSSTNGSSVRARIGLNYYEEKARVDRSGYLSVLNRLLVAKRIHEKQYRVSATRFLVRLAETMSVEGETALATSLLDEASKYDFEEGKRYAAERSTTSQPLANVLRGGSV